MKAERVIECIEKLINNEIDDWSIEGEDQTNVVEVDLENIVNRLINTYNKYKSGVAGKADFLSSLRSFMISFRTELRVNNHELLKNNSFGIFYNSSTNKYYATYEIPDYINHKSFIENTFININTSYNKKSSPYSLHTNTFIDELTGFSRFKSMEQKLCVFGAMNTPNGYTTLISMPTGGGKSLITQTVGYEKRGLSIVIVPTVSLAIDQERVAKKNIKKSKEGEIYSYYSGCNNSNRIFDAIKAQSARLLFISPEALIKNEVFHELITQANTNKYLKNIIIDEAHIVVAWGDFFRMDYQCLGPWRKDLMKINPEIRTFLLSATFKDDTVDTLKKIFGEEGKWIELRCDALRKEPHFILVKASGYKDKERKTIDLVNILPKPMILYVNSPFDAERWRKQLQYYGFQNVKTFTGETKSAERMQIINQWSDNQFEIMIATSAFGVGVDKQDVRSVVHLYVPESPDSYYQELGRGGRDGLSSLSVMCIESNDVSKAFNHVSKVLTTEKLLGRWWSMYRNPENMWSGGEIAVFASTKPNYSRTDFFEEGNNSDEKWNINALLLLSRYDLIKITAIELDNNNRYIFTIRILNESITINSDKTRALFDDIRNKEALKSLSAFALIKNAIERESHNCWSSMFYDTYPLVSEYCPGCGNHEEEIFDEIDRFPLLLEIEGPSKQLSLDAKSLFSDTHDALVIARKTKKQIVDEYKPDIIVSENEWGYDEPADQSVMYVNYQELRALMKHDKGFFVSGLIMAIYSDDPNLAIEEYQVMQRCARKGNYIIHVTDKDFIVSKSSGKTISLDIDGSVIS